MRAECHRPSFRTTSGRVQICRVTTRSLATSAVERTAHDPAAAHGPRPSRRRHSDRPRGTGDQRPLPTWRRLRESRRWGIRAAARWGNAAPRSCSFSCVVPECRNLQRMLQLAEGAWAFPSPGGWGRRRLGQVFKAAGAERRFRRAEVRGTPDRPRPRVVGTITAVWSGFRDASTPQSERRSCGASRRAHQVAMQTPAFRSRATVENCESPWMASGVVARVWQA